MTSPRSAMQEVSPKLAEIAAEVLFGEIILHTSFYAGVPVGANAVRVAMEFFDERGI